MGLLQVQIQQHYRPKERGHLKVLNDYVIPSIEVFFPDDMGIFQDNNSRLTEPQIVKEWFWDDETLFHTWKSPICSHRCLLPTCRTNSPNSHGASQQPADMPLLFSMRFQCVEWFVSLQKELVETLFFYITETHLPSM